MKCLICGDPAIPSQRIYGEMQKLEENGVTFKLIDWKKGFEVKEFVSVILDIEHNGPEKVEPFKDMLDEVADADFLIVHFAPVSRKIIEKGKKLRMIGCIRGGIENVNVESAKEKGVLVLNAPGRTTGAVSDFTIGMVISLIRKIPEFNSALKKGAWMTFDRDKLPYNLEGKILGAIGFGNIGKAVAKRASSFGMKVLAYDPFVSKDIGSSLDVDLVNLDTLLRNSDIVTVHARLSPETKNMIGEREFKLMKKTAYFVNTARSGLVNEKALIRALEEKWIAGAALDVFEEEPLSSTSKFFQLDNVVLTPHIAGSTIDTSLNGPRMMFKEIMNIIKLGKTSYHL